MKKFFLLTIISALVLGVSSCKSDDDEDHALVGTQWVNLYEDDDFSEEVTLSFVTASTGNAVVIDSDGNNETTPFTYTYSHPTVSITTVDGTMNGTINGNTLTTIFKYEGEEDSVTVYTKK